MTRLQARFRTVVARCGEDLGGFPAVVAPLSPFRARSYVSDAEIDVAGRPLWVAYTAHDHPAAEGATVAWGARSLVVKRAIEVRFAGKTVARLLMLVVAGSGSDPEGS